MSDIFALAANYNAGNNTADLAIGDFNHDGKTRYNTNFGSATVSVLLGRGDSTFRSIIFYNDITIGDLTMTVNWI
ncbi:MAG: hypothetical protein MRQ13_05790 [Candidatus Midichloria sp.]|nr:hypothetical protein [Candidatus Midichloria sp.]